jgi:hypothetical protein
VIAAWGALVAAAADPALDERLLGGADPEPAAVTESPWPPLWPFGLAAAGAALAVWARRKGSPSDNGEIRLISMIPLGKDNGLAVVEVMDADGVWRRLLVGSGTGAPQLLTDLGEPEPADPFAAAPVAPARGGRAARSRALVEEVLVRRTGSQGSA